jgi:hypothetical protein
MIGLLCFVLAAVASIKSKMRLEAENAVLRHQLIVVRRRLHSRVRLTNHDRWFFIQLYRWVPSILKVLTIIQPETLVRWRRAGFRCYWRWKLCPQGRRPQIDTELRAVIWRITRHPGRTSSPLWSDLGFSVHSSNQRPDTLMQDRLPPDRRTSCNARPDHTSGSRAEGFEVSRCGLVMIQVRKHVCGATHLMSWPEGDFIRPGRRRSKQWLWITPTALAVLRLTTNSYLVGALHGKIGPFLALSRPI